MKFSDFIQAIIKHTISSNSCEIKISSENKSTVVFCEALSVEMRGFSNITDASGSILEHVSDAVFCHGVEFAITTEGVDSENIEQYQDPLFEGEISIQFNLATEVTH